VNRWSVRVSCVIDSKSVRPGVAVASEDVESSLREGEPSGAGGAEVLRETTSRIEEAISWRDV
jgi:hypothetical protein